MPQITATQLGKVIKNPAARKNLDAWAVSLNAAMSKWKINTPTRIAAFIAQVMQESAELSSLSENLNYSAPRLRQVWPARFPNDVIAKQYANNPEKLANFVYGNRLGNGGEASGDGWRYRGRGLIQLTGKANYADCAKATGLDLLNNPDLLTQPQGMAESAAWFWSSKGLNELADKLAHPDDKDAHFLAITKTVNGGTEGSAQRVAYWNAAETAFA